MQTINVRLPDGIQPLNFPDDMSDSEISSAIEKEYGANPANSANQASSQNMNAQILNNITGGNRTPLDTIRDLLSGALTGAAKGGEFLNRQEMRIPGAQNLAQAIRNKLGITANVSDQDVNQMLQQVASPNKSIGGNIAQGVGEYLPYARIGGAGLGGQLVSGAAFGAGTADQNQKNLFGLLPEGSTGSAIENAALNAITHGAFSAANALRPSNLFRGNLSPQELQKNLAAAGNTTTGLGDVIGSPFLKRQYENVISKLPFSGATEKLQQAGQAVTDQGTNLLKQILGNNNPNNITDQISDALNKQFQSNKALKNSLYDNVNQLADESNLQLSLPTFAKKAQDYSDAIASTNMLKYEPDIAKIFSKLQNYKNPVSETQNVGAIVDQSGKPLINETQINAPTLQEANILKGKLNDYAKMARYSPDASQRYAANVFSDLASSLKGDIKSSIEDSGNDDLKSAYNDAETNYAKNYSPFLDKKIYKYVSGNPSANTDKIAQDFITTSRSSDQANNIAKISKLLEPQQKNLLSYAYFSRALDNQGNLNPATLSTLIKNLGKNQFKTLVPDDNLRSQLVNYKKLYSMNNKAVNLMQNPATGQQNLDLLPALLAHAVAGVSGGTLGGPIGAVAGLIAPGVVSRPLVNALTSPAVRESLVRKMIANQPWSKKPVPYLQAALRGSTLNNQQGS